MFIVNMAMCQQVPMYNQHYLSPFIYNPSLAGASGETSLFLIHKAQWSGMPGGPRINSINVDGAVGKENKAGLGLSFFNDKTSILNRIGGYASYSYKLKINEDHNFRLGLGVGVMNTRIDFDQVVVKDQNDQSLYNLIRSKAVIGGNVGLTYNWKKLQVGFAIPQLFNPRVNYQDGNKASTYYKMARHFIGTTKYEFFVLNNDISLTPLGMVRFMPGTPVQYEGHIIAKYKDFVGLGVSYKSNYAVALSAMVKPYNNLTIGYSYDIIISGLSNYARVSHEIVLGYTFGSKKEERIKKLEDQQIETNDHLMKSDSINDTQDGRITINEKEIDSLKQNMETLEKNIEILEDSVKLFSKDLYSVKSFDKDANPTDRTGASKDFVDDKGNQLKIGGYIIVGVFRIKENANEYGSKLNSSVLILNKISTLYYVYTEYDSDYSSLRNKLKKARANIDSNSWILHLK